MRKEKIMEIGEKHNFLTCISQECVEVNNRGERHKHAIFKCDCGNEKKIQCSFVRRGKSKSCGKTCRLLKTRPYRARKIGEPIKIGDKFGFLTVIKDFFDKSKKNPFKSIRYFECKCECGNTSIISSYEIRARVRCGRDCEFGKKNGKVKKSVHQYFIGQKIKRLTVTDLPYYVTEIKNGRIKKVKFIRCECECGEKIDVACRRLNEKTKSECKTCAYNRKSEESRKCGLENDGYKKCSKCGIDRKADCYYKAKNTKDGYYSQCEKCHRSSYYQRKYGIDADIYDSMIKTQNYSCAICKTTEPQSFGINKDKNLFHVDHDHQTGKIRGLLCFKCNTSLGGFKDKIEFLENAILYLKEHADENDRTG